jgi:hypothetical protein
MLSTPIHRLPDLIAGQFEFALKGRGFTGSGKTQFVSGHRFDLTLHTALWMGSPLSGCNRVFERNG